MLSKRNQMRKDKYHTISLMCNITNEINRQAKPNKNKEIVLQNEQCSLPEEEVGSEGEVVKGVNHMADGNQILGSEHTVVYTSRDISCMYEAYMKLYTNATSIKNKLKKCWTGENHMLEL